MSSTDQIPADLLKQLVEMAMRQGLCETEKARDPGTTGILRLNVTLAVRHGKPQGGSSSLVFEKKLGL